MVRAGDWQHWNQRAASGLPDAQINIHDVFQRDLEFEFLLSCLKPSDTVLETGCGNGFSTDRIRQVVEHVDAFDVSPRMIEQARETQGEQNNTFFNASVLEPIETDRVYDAAVCVRVLINVPDLDAQLLALRNLTAALKDGGRLVLIEGFRDGFEALSGARQELGMPALEPAAVNFYSYFEQIEPFLDATYELESTFHSGTYDYYTRVLYPLLVGAENVEAGSEYSQKLASLARCFNPEGFRRFSRLRGLLLRKVPGGGAEPAVGDESR